MEFSTDAVTRADLDDIKSSIMDLIAAINQRNYSRKDQFDSHVEIVNKHSSALAHMKYVSAEQVAEIQILKKQVALLQSEMEELKIQKEPVLPNLKKDAEKVEPKYIYKKNPSWPNQQVGQPRRVKERNPKYVKPLKDFGDSSDWTIHYK